MNTTRIDKYQDVIDSREIIERITELEAMLELSETEDVEDFDQAELDTLKALAAEASDYSEDWEYGATLIRDSYFTTYAQELADDVMPSDEARELAEAWPFRCIDWEQAARELQMDYTAVDFDGVTYWVR